MGWIEGKSYTTETDSKNSSQTPLLIGDDFTGEGVKNEYASVMVVLSTDQNGTLYCEFSIDGQNWDTSLSFNYDTARINPPHIFEKGSRYFRVRFVNDSGVDQTYFRLGTYYGSFQKLTSPINGTLSENYDALVVRPTDYKSEVAMNKRQGRSVVNKFGFNKDVDTGGAEIVASFGGSFDPLVNIMSTVQTFNINYDNSLDGSGTSGALSLLITYLGDDFLEKTAVHVLGSTGSDTTSFEGLGINRALVLSNGGTPYNVGNIDIEASVDNTIQARIPIESGVTEQCILHTQINHNFLVDYVSLNTLKLSGGGSSPRVVFKMFSYSRVTQTRYNVLERDIDTDVVNDIEVTFPTPLVFGGREVIYLEAETNNNNTEVIARFSGVQERIS